MDRKERLAGEESKEERQMTMPLNTTPFPDYRPLGGGENQTPALNEALAKAQGEFLPVKKSKVANVKMKSGGTYKFSYADLADVIAATTPALSKHGLSVTMPLSQSERTTTLSVVLRHSSGDAIKTSLPIAIPQGNPQELGSLLSYYRRYLLSSLLNVASEEDDDGNLASGNDTEITQKNKKPEPRVVEQQQQKGEKIFNMDDKTQAAWAIDKFKKAGISDEDIVYCLECLDGLDIHTNFAAICDKFRPKG